MRDFEVGRNVSCEESTVSVNLYLNGVTDLRQLTSHSTIPCLTTWRSYRDHRLVSRHFTCYSHSCSFC